MADLLRAAARRAGFRRALRLYLVEASPVLRRRAAAPPAPPRPNRAAFRRRRRRAARTGRCCSSPTSSSTRCRFGSWCAAATAGPSALGRGSTPDRSAGLCRGPGKSGPRAAGAARPCATRRPARWSRSARPPRRSPASLGERLARRPGAALFIDYGYFPSRPGADPGRGAPPSAAARSSTRPGEADLSAHVDFAGFAEAARAAGAAVHGPVPQARLPARARRRGAARGAVAARRPRRSAPRSTAASRA